jgi:hypothetical protein
MYSYMDESCDEQGKGVFVVGGLQIQEGSLTAGGLSLGSVSGALQAGDQYSNIRILVQVQQDNN